MVISLHDKIHILALKTCILTSEKLKKIHWYFRYNATVSVIDLILSFACSALSIHVKFMCHSKNITNEVTSDQSNPIVILSL